MKKSTAEIYAFALRGKLSAFVVARVAVAIFLLVAAFVYAVMS